MIKQGDDGKEDGPWCTTDEHKQNFITSLVSTMEAMDVDGVDIDWETTIDADILKGILELINTEFERIGPRSGGRKRYGLSMAVWPDYSPDLYDLQTIRSHVGEVNLMSYQDINIMKRSIVSFGNGKDGDEEEDSSETEKNKDITDPKVGEQVESKRGGVQIAATVDGSDGWKLLEGETATVVEVDEDGDFRLRSPDGLESSFVYAASFVYNYDFDLDGEASDDLDENTDNLDLDDASDDEEDTESQLDDEFNDKDTEDLVDQAIENALGGMSSGEGR